MSPAERLQAHARRAAEAAPELTEEQTARLRTILRRSWDSSCPDLAKGGGGS